MAWKERLAAERKASDAAAMRLRAMLDHNKASKAAPTAQQVLRRNYPASCQSMPSHRHSGAPATGSMRSVGPRAGGGAAYTPAVACFGLGEPSRPTR